MYLGIKIRKEVVAQANENFSENAAPLFLAA